MPISANGSPAEPPPSNSQTNGQTIADRASEQPSETIEAEPKDIDLGRRFFNIKTLASFVVALAIMFFLATRINIDIRGTLRALAGANPLYLGLAIISYYSVFPVRALRWRRMLVNSGVPTREVPGLPLLVRIIFLSWFANCLVPAKLGDVYRAFLLHQWARISGSKAGGTIIAERLLDLATLLVLAAGAGLASFWGQPRKLSQLVGPLEIMGGFIVAGVVVLLLLKFGSGWLRSLLPSRIHGLYARFTEGALGAFGGWSVLLPLSLLAWLCEIFRLFFVCRSIGVILSPSLPTEFAMVTAVALVASLLTALPLTPAGLGVVESGVVFSLLLIGVQSTGSPLTTSDSLAFSVAFLDRTISYLSLVAIGLVVYLLSMRRGHQPSFRAASLDPAASSAREVS